MKGLLERLLVVVNGSDASISAAKYAIALSKATGGSVTAAYVVDTATIRQLAMSRIFIAEEGEEYERSLEETGKHYLDFVVEIGRAKRVAVKTQMLRGSITGEIVKLAEEIDADCILMGGLERESSAQDPIRESQKEIARVAPCSILMVRSHDAEVAYKAT